MKLDQLLQLNLSNKKTYIAEAKKLSQEEKDKRAADRAAAKKKKDEEKATKPKASPKPRKKAEPKADKPKTPRKSSKKDFDKTMDSVMGQDYHKNVDEKRLASKASKASAAAEKAEPYVQKPAADTPAAKLKAQVDSEPTTPTAPSIIKLPDNPRDAILLLKSSLLKDPAKRGAEWDPLKQAIDKLALVKPAMARPSLASRLKSRLGAAAPKFATKGGAESAAGVAGEIRSGLGSLKARAKKGLQGLGLWENWMGDDFVADLADLITEDPDVTE